VGRSLPHDVACAILIRSVRLRHLPASIIAIAIIGAGIRVGWGRLM
jgi:hypothetical protein